MPSPLTTHRSLLKIGAGTLWQAEFTRSELARVEVDSEIFVLEKEIENALLRGDIEVAVHSMNDLPTTQREGLVVTAVSQRGNSADWLVTRRESIDSGKIFKLKEGATIGESAPHRKAQLLDFRPDVQLKNASNEPLARLEGLRSGDFDACFLAAAEVSRLGLDLSDFEVIELNPRELVPAPAQGVLAWQSLRDDTATRLMLKKIHHPEVSACTNVERGLLRFLGEIPLGAFCERDATGNFHAFAACLIGDTLRRTRLSSSTTFGMTEKLAAALQSD